MVVGIIVHVLQGRRIIAALERLLYDGDIGIVGIYVLLEGPETINISPPMHFIGLKKLRCQTQIPMCQIQIPIQSN